MVMCRMLTKRTRERGGEGEKDRESANERESESARERERLCVGFIHTNTAVPGVQGRGVTAGKAPRGRTMTKQDSLLRGVPHASCPLAVFKVYHASRR